MEHYFVIIGVAVGGIFALKLIKAVLFRILLFIAVICFVLYLLA